MCTLLCTFRLEQNIVVPCTDADHFPTFHENLSTNFKIIFENGSDNLIASFTDKIHSSQQAQQYG